MMGRWINRDPIEEGGGINLYAYVENDPAGFTDATGLIPTPGIIECDCKQFLLSQQVIDKIRSRHGPGGIAQYNTNDRSKFFKDFWEKLDNKFLKDCLCDESHASAAERGRVAYVCSGHNERLKIGTKGISIKPTPVGKVYPRWGSPYDTDVITIIVKPFGDPQLIETIHPGFPSTGDE